jgi:hypothetical protein
MDEKASPELARGGPWSSALGRAAILAAVSVGEVVREGVTREQ